MPRGRCSPYQAVGCGPQSVPTPQSSIGKAVSYGDLVGFQLHLNTDGFPRKSKSSRITRDRHITLEQNTILEADRSPFLGPNRKNIRELIGSRLIVHFRPTRPRPGSTVAPHIPVTGCAANRSFQMLHAPRNPCTRRSKQRGDPSRRASS